MKKTLALILSLIMVISMVPMSASADAEIFTMNDWYPVVNEGEDVTLRVAVFQSADQADASEIWWWKFMEEKMNIKTEVEQYSNRTEARNLIFGTGDVPDLMIALNATTAEIVRYGMEDGLLLKLDEYMDKGYMPNLKAIYDANPSFKSALLAPDGHLYSVGNIGEKENWSKISRVFINETWLKEAELEIPKTLDEFIDMLRVFAKRDDCEVAMGGGFGAVNPGLVIMTALGYVTESQTGTSICLRNGEVRLPYGDREIWPEYLKIMNTLWNEGLISKDYYTLTTAQVRATAANLATGILADTPYLSNAETWNQFVSVEPLTSKWNDTPVWPDNNDNLTSGIVLASANTDYPELVATLIDTLFNKTGIVYWLVGPQAGSDDLVGMMSGWYLDENCGYQFIDLDNDTAGVYGASGFTYRMKKIGALPGYVAGLTGNNITQRMAEMEGREWFLADLDVTQADPHYQASLRDHVGPYLQEQFPTIVFFDGETSDRIKELNTLLGDYFPTEVANFITGKTEINEENLNKYFDTLDSLGYQELLGYYVEYYENYKANK